MGEKPKEMGEIPKHVGEILRHLGEKPKKCGRKSAEYLGEIVREKRKPIKSGDEELPNEMGEKVRKMKNMHTKVGLKRIPHQVKWEKKCGKAGPMPLQMGGLINCR